jgi:hypothetical protein
MEAWKMASVGLARGLGEEDALSAATSPHEFKLLLTKATGQAY